MRYGFGQSLAALKRSYRISLGLVLGVFGALIVAIIADEV